MAKNSWDIDYKKKLLPPDALQESVENMRSWGKTIATINGSFDLMHAGHLHILYEASKQADVLIVALNSDSSIQQYKDPTRPIIPLAYRLQMMAAIGFVDYVTWFEETDPRALLTLIKPDIHVNGSEYGQNCIEADTVHRFGGQLHIVGLKPGLSTSTIIERIVDRCPCD